MMTLDSMLRYKSSLSTEAGTFLLDYLFLSLRFMRLHKKRSLKTTLHNLHFFIGPVFLDIVGAKSNPS